MKPGLGFVTWILIAGAVHALILLLPRPAGLAGERIPTIELTLADTQAEPSDAASARPAGGGPVVRGPSPRAAAPAAQSAAEPAASPATPELSPPGVEAAADPAPAPAVGQAAESGVAVVPRPAAVDAGTGFGTDAPGTAVDARAAGGGGGNGSTAAGEALFTPPRVRKGGGHVYPWRARRAHVEGIAVVKALIDASGAVISAEISTSSGDAILDKAALEEVRRSRFQPALQGGKSVPAPTEVKVTYKLE